MNFETLYTYYYPCTQSSGDIGPLKKLRYQFEVLPLEQTLYTEKDYPPEMVKASIRALKLCQKVVGTEEEKWNKGMHILYSFNQNYQGQYTLNRCAGERTSKIPTILLNIFIVKQIFPDSQYTSGLK